MKHLIKTILIVFLLLSSLLLAQSVEPITGTEFDSLIASQNLEIQKELEKIFPESEGYIVSGRKRNTSVICNNYLSYQTAYKIIENSYQFSYIYDFYPISCYMNPFNPSILVSTSFKAKFSTLSDHEREIQIIDISNDLTDQFAWLYTIQDYRHSLWLPSLNYDEIISLEDSVFFEDMVEYFEKIDSGFVDVEPPLAKDYDLPETFDLYVPAPDYVIQGYQNYKDFLYNHAEIKTEFISGVTEFTASGDALLWFKDNAPREAYPNKEWRMLQHEYKKFFERGGDMRSMQTLTSDGFDTLTTGEYFFAVAPSGKIRFGRELLREEVERLEKETGKKVPRANHAFLFPGEYILTAGAFFIDDAKVSKLARVNAQSGHFFYSNINASIREDISEKSDHYLLTLGHFFKSLDNLEISYDSIIISKF